MNSSSKNLRDMTLSSTPRILFIHSDVRSYRVPIFQMLHERYPIQFLFMYGGGFARQFSETKTWNYKDMKPYPMIGYSNDFSPGLVRELIARRAHYDIVIVSGLTSFATHAAFPLVKLLGKKLIVWGEDWVWPNIFIARIALPYIRFIVQHSDACIAAGTKTRDFFLSLGANPKKVFIASNCALDISTIPIDNAKLNALRININPAGKIIISYFGRIIRYKALDTLIEAFAKLEQERNDVLLLIAGDGPFSNECKDLINKLKLKNFYWSQYDMLSGTITQEPVPQSELIYYYHLTDIFVLPGRFIWRDNVPCESWGFTINESLSLGIPSISTTSVAAAFDLLNEEYIAEEGSISSLLKRLKYLLTIPLKEGGERQKQRLESTVSYQKMFDGFHRAIKSTL